MAPSNMLFELIGRANPTPSTDNRTGTDTRIFDLPQSVLAKIPALLPPPGETSNFVNPEDIGGVLVGISIFGLTILVICVSIRLWVIFRLLRPIKWAWSDVVFTVAILTSIALAVIASCLSIVYRCIEERSLDSTWNILPVDAIAALELAIGIIIACTPHIAKFLRIYGNAFSRAYSIIAYYLCCKPRKMAGSTKGSKESKGTKETDTFNSSTPKRLTKLYPGLDLTTFGGTHLDNVDEENEIKKVSSESPTDQHPAAQYPEDVHWAERHRGMQESFVDGV
ncbi:hypothetical protein NHQ30_009196 [Ciborinia camelliae]|nr:hypothetical protein NHQ30_009196 [Ciborinia camelliae]